MIIFNENDRQFELWGYDPKISEPPIMLVSCPTLEAAKAAQRLLFSKETYYTARKG